MGCDSILNYFMIKFVRLTFHLQVRELLLWALAIFLLLQSVGHARRYEFEEVEITYHLFPKEKNRVVFYVRVSPRRTKILHIPSSSSELVENA